MDLLALRLSRRKALAAAAAAATFALFGAAKCATIANLALRNGRLFTATDEPIIEGGTVAIRDATIIAVGRDEDVVLGEDTRVIDVRGAFVMPGLIDTHVHVTEALLLDEPILPAWLRAGITTIRDTGTIWQGPELLRTLVAKQEVAPRLIATGGLFTAPGGYPTSRGAAATAGSMIVADAAEAIRAVHATIDAGAEFIKVAVETGRPGGTLHLDAGEPTLSLDLVRAITATAHERGVSVTAHVTNEWELRRALDGGVDSLAHTPIDLIPEDLLRRIIDGPIPMSSTGNIWNGGEFTTNVQTNIARVHAGGGVVAMGTDFPFQVHAGIPLGELQILSGAGLSNAQILRSATRDAALMCGRSDLGTLEAGRTADVIVVGGAPLSRLDDLERVSMVLQAGREVGGVMPI